MNSNDKEKFVEIMIGLADIYSATTTTSGLNFRFDALKQFSLDQITEASNIIVRTRKYTTMPTPADFIEAIQGSNEDLAEIQASLVSQAISQFGSYNKPIFADPITADIMNHKINWGDLCASSEKDVNFKLKEFKSLYKTYNKATSGNLLNAPDEIKKLADSSTKRIE